MPHGAQDSYNPANNQLFIASGTYKGRVYTNVTVTVGNVLAVAPGPFTLSGSIQGAPNATVYLTQGGQSTTTQADSSGNYSFSGLVDGTYTVTPSLSGNSFTPSQNIVTIKGASGTVTTFVASAATDSLTEAQIAAIDALPVSSLSLTEMTNPDGTTVAEYLASLGIVLPGMPSTGGGLPAVPGVMAPPTSSGIGAMGAGPAITYPSGLTPTEQLQAVIDVMVGEAGLLSCRRAIPIPSYCTNMFQFPAGLPAYIYPAQDGLAYVYGGKNPTKRILDQGCPQYRYGVDCSGLIFVIAELAGIDVVAGPASGQANPSNWTIPSDWGITIAPVTDGSQLRGDIEIFNHHVGILATGSTGAVNVISSMGDNGACDTNGDARHGPISYTFAGVTQAVGPTISVLRLQVATPINTSVSVVPNPTSLPSNGGPITLTATITPTSTVPSGTPLPGGFIDFVDQSGITLCVAASVTAGVAVCSTTINSAPDTITGNYLGDTNYAPSAGSMTVSLSPPTAVTATFTYTGTNQGAYSAEWYYGSGSFVYDDATHTLISFSATINVPGGTEPDATLSPAKFVFGTGDVYEFSFNPMTLALQLAAGPVPDSLSTGYYPEYFYVCSGGGPSPFTLNQTCGSPGISEGLDATQDFSDVAVESGPVVVTITSSM